MSRRSRERKLRILEEKQEINNEMKMREQERTAPVRKMTKRILFTLAGTAAIVLLAWGGVVGGKYLISGAMNKVTGPFGEIEKTELEASKNLTLKTNKGDIAIELDTKNTPKAAANFVLLAKNGFYDGVKFHRIIKDFMIQGGDPLSKDDDPLNDGIGGPGYAFDDERITKAYVRGTLAMANSGPNTNGSQFFIMHADYELPPNYVIFGSMTDGFDVLDDIADTQVTANSSGEESVPSEDIIIESITFN